MDRPSRKLSAMPRGCHHRLGAPADRRSPFAE
jgi:hypothetical protein